MLFIYCGADIPLDTQIDKGSIEFIQKFFSENYLTIQYFHDQCEASNDKRNLFPLQKNNPLSDLILRNLSYKMSPSMRHFMEQAKDSHQKRKKPPRIVVDAIVPTFSSTITLSASQEFYQPSSESEALHPKLNNSGDAFVPRSPSSCFNFENAPFIPLLVPDETCYNQPYTTSQNLNTK